MRITLGVDAHKEQHTVVAIDEVGRYLSEITLPNDRAGYAQAYQWACGLGAVRQWGVENSGPFGRALAQYLLRQGEQVLEVSPHLTGRQRRRSRQPAKCDPHDALAVARLVLQEAHPLPRVVPEDQTTQVKLWVEQRDNLVGERTRLLNRLHAQLTEADPHYKASLGLLTQAQTLRQCQAYPLPPDDPIGQVRVTIIQQLATVILQLEEQIEQVTQHLQPLVTQLAPSLVSIQGISWLHAAQLIARVGRIETMASSAALARHAGLAPMLCGTAGNYYHRVSPRGDRQLNAVFHRIAQVQSRHNLLAQAYLAKKKAAGKTAKHAFRCLKRRMVDIVYAVWKSGKPYQAPATEVAEAA